MITLFTTPRPFEGHYQIIQVNALKSWARLRPWPDRVVVFADEEHEGEFAVAMAETLNFQVEPVARRSPRGVPLVNWMFARAREITGDDGISCYVNCDIILEGGVVDAVSEAINSFPTDRYKTCLVVGGRWNVQVLDYLEFTEGWEAELREKVDLQGSRSPECLIDLFAWKGDILDNLKDFVIGRYVWDNALVGTALQRGAAVVDITPRVRLTHQAHHIVDWNDPDATHNKHLIAPKCGLKDSTHTLTEDGLIGGWKP